MKRATMCICALLLVSVACAAQDADMDGIPNAVEVDLGSDPDRAEQFVRLYHDGVAGEDDETVREDLENAPDFVDVSLANVAQDRWLWRITFADDYVGDTNTFILYLDVDRSPNTGRQDAEWARGTDLMFVQANGEFSLTRHTEGMHPDPPRMAHVGDAMYICADLPLGEGTAEGLVRFRVLSHVSPPGERDADEMRWAEAPVPDRRDAQKPRVGLPCALAPVAALTTERPDGDGDGIPDEVETVLGMDDEHADALRLVGEDGTVAAGDEDDSFEHANDIERMYFGNAAGNRWVWRIDFAEEFDSSGGTLIILYLDCDNDRSTGRQDKGNVRGTDMMLTCNGGAFGASIRNPDVLMNDRNVRGIIDGRSIYYSMDLQLNHNEQGNTEYRAYVLSQQKVKGGGNDSTEWFTVCGPGASDRPAPRVGCLSEIRSEGVWVEEPWLYWREGLRELDAVTVDLTAGQRNGMRVEDRSLVAEAQGASATVTAPVSGSYHLNFVLQDSAEREERVQVFVAGELVALMVAADNDGLIHVYSTPEPVALERGDAIRFVCDGPAQDARISELTLTREMLRPPGLTISNIATFCSPLQRGETVDVDLCFLTSRPITGRVRWGEGEALEHIAQEDSATYNHRVTLRGIERGATCHYQVEVGAGESALRSETATVVAEPLRPERCAVEREQIALSVTDPLEDRPVWPVTGGVPVPEGHLRDASHCRLLQDGEPVAADLTELAWWPDGSVRWLLVSVVHRGGDYALEYGQQVARPEVPRPIRVEETEEGLRVTTDVLRAEVSREHFSPPGDLWRDLDGDGAFTDAERIAIADEGALLTDAQGNTYSTAGRPVERLVVEEAGPVRTVLLAEGRFAGDAGELLSYRCRMYFYRGFAGVPTVLTLVNDEGTSVRPPTMTRIESLTVPVRFGRELTADDVPPGETRQMLTEGMRLLHDYDDRYLVTRGDETQEQPGHTNAAVGLSCEEAGVRRSLAVTMRDFWQLYPKGYSARGSRLVAEIFPDLPDDQYADEDLTPFEQTRHYYWFSDGSYAIPMGVALGYDLLFYAFDDAAAKEQMDAAWDTIPLLTSSPEQMCGSGALGQRLEPEQEGVFDSFQAYVDEGFDRLQERRESVREYDWMNFGDTHGERRVNWTNQEYDLQWGLLVQFARSGDWRFFDRAEEAARHTAAVDTIHAAPSERLVGIQKAHCVGHTGGFDLDRPEDATYWYSSGIWNTGHMWSQGTFTAYCLTGDRRYYRAAKLLADWLAREEATRLSPQVHRNYGWTTIAALGAYRVTPHPWYLNAARLFTQNAISRQDPGTGAFIHGIGECEHEVRHMGGKTFMTGVVMTGMKMLDQIDPDPELKRSIVRSADWIHWRMWHPQDNSFQYAQCTQFDDRSTHAGTYMACEGLAYAYELRPEAIYREMLVRSLGDMIINRGPSGSGKSYAMQIRMTPFALSIMQGWGMTKLPAPPPPEPRVGTADTVYLPPDAPGLLAVRVANSGHRALAAEAEIVELPEGLTADRERVQWSASSGTNLGPTFALSGEAEGRVTVRCTVEGLAAPRTLSASLRPARPLRIGDGVGLVTGEEDPVAAALDRLGMELLAVEELSEEVLAEHGALLVGAEAHEKDFAGMRKTWPLLLDFVHSGGRVAIIQLQNTSYEASFLPLPLALSNESGELAQIVAPEHPVFTTPAATGPLAGVISYDTIVSADEGWTVLARDDRGGPAILHADFGDGDVLVVEPSPDRYVIESETPPPGLEVEACAQLLRNLVAWLEAR